MDRKNLFTRLLILLLTLMFFGGVILGIVNLLSSEGQEPPEETAQQSANPLPGEPQEILAYISRLSERASHENAGLKKCYEISIDDGFEVKSMVFAYDAAKVDEAIAETSKMKGIFHVRVWLNEGRLKVGEDIMYVLIGGDIRPHVVDALQFLVEKIKSECVSEVEE